MKTTSITQIQFSDEINIYYKDLIKNKDYDLKLNE